MVPRAFGGPALILNLVYVTGGLGGNLRGPGARAYMNFMKAGCIDQAIFIAAVAAILDLLHYPPSGGGARLRHLWAELSGVPAHFSLRVTLVQSRRAEDGSCLCPGEAELAENRGPVTRTGWERPLRPELRWQALLGDVLGATSLFQLVPRHQQRALRPGQQPPGTLPGGCRPRRSVGLLLFPDADGVGEDGRPA